MTRQPSCPSCDAVLVSKPAGTPLRCRGCNWRLITLEEWLRLTPFQQGYEHYMQAAWPTSPLVNAKNHYAEGTPEWEAFCRGEQCAVNEAQDSEE